MRFFRKFLIFFLKNACFFLKMELFYVSVDNLNAGYQRRSTLIKEAGE